MKKSLLLFLCILLSISVSYNQINENFTAEIESSLKSFVDSDEVIGLSLAIKVGDEVWATAAGVSSDTDTLNTNALLAQGSISKTIISACILDMMEEGILSLSDPISMFLPTYEFIDSTVTVKELLNHTSGIFNYTDHPFFGQEVVGSQQSHTYTPMEVLEQYVTAPSFSRGAKQEYSNTNYVILGMIITKLSGRPYYEEIFERFDMPNNYPSFGIPPFTHPTTDLANLWADLGTGPELLDVEAAGLDLTGIFSSAGAAGAFTATPTDLVNWGYDLYSGKLLSQASMDSLLDYHPLLLSGQVNYGLGVFNYDICGVSLIGHGGNIVYTADLAYVPELDLAIAVMTNDGSGLPTLGGVQSISANLICGYMEYLTSVNEPSVSNSNLRVYPIPATDETNIDLELEESKDLTVSLYNEIGKLLDQKQYFNTQHLQETIHFQSDWNAGVYYIQINDGDQVYTRKVIKI